MIVDTNPCFDYLFAEDMCKPLPELYNENNKTELVVEGVANIVPEENSVGFYLPGLFEVFPEFKLKWPVWSKNKKGDKIVCEKDEDCKFPETCCIHPFLPGEKFCCTGFGTRRMVPAYVCSSYYWRLAFLVADVFVFDFRVCDDVWRSGNFAILSNNLSNKWLSISVG